MPYGNKSLHFGHVGGMFVHADVFARFLRDRIGKENVVFVSGTDCYGSPIAEGYRKKVEQESYKGTIEDYVMENHNSQLKTLQDYEISLDIFGGSALEDTKDVHQEETNEFIETLYKNGWLEKLVTKQFYDTKYDCFLNGRQVVGKCPIENCQSEKGYADECDLGHQYMPEELIDPKSTLSGETPEMRDVTNWYFKLTEFNDLLEEYVADIENKQNVRKIVSKTMKESLGQPVIYIQEKFLQQYKAIESELPEHTNSDLENIKGSFTVSFKKLTDREKACPILTKSDIHYRTGKTLVPLRLTGNIEWGVNAPSLEGEKDLTVWVWPESLWAPISFTKAYFKRKGESEDRWKDFWCDPEAGVFQFIGQDNIYFYGPKSAGEKPYGTISNPYEHFGTFIPLPPSFSWEVMEDGRYTVFSATPPYQHYICTMRYIEPRPQLGLSEKEKALGNKNYAYDESYMEVTLEKEGSGSLAVLGTYYPYFYERYTQEHPERDLDNTFFQLWGTIVYYLYRL